MLSLPGWIPLHRLALLVALVVAVASLALIDSPTKLTRPLRRRFILGVPWGTLVCVGGVLGVYLFVQGGYESWYRPLTIPFRAWSFLYPTGMVFAPFSHSGVGHLIGNLIGTLTLAPLAEYIWSHYPTRRGSTSFGSLRENPYVRAFVIFPLVVFGVGILTSIFALGPVIGFSGVVFAFAGFALVTRPLTTILALFSGRVFRLFYDAIVTPELTASAGPVFSSPWWAEIALQGHALGLLIGLLLGVGVMRYRNETPPSGLRSFAGVLLFAVGESMWAVYWFRGSGTYVLFRAIGFALIIVLAMLVALTVVSSNRPLRQRAPVGSLLSVRRWQVGFAVLLVVVAALAGPSIPYNLVTASGEDLPGESISVRDYEVTYAENVPNGLTAAFDLELFGESTTTNTSGVIVQSEQRGIWTTAVTTNRLAFSGYSTVRLGGVGWRDEVTAVRDGYVVTGAKPAYRVFLVTDNETRLAHTTPPIQAEPVVGNRNISVVPTETGYDLAVSRGNQTVRGPLPTKNVSVVLDQVRFVRNGKRIFAEYGGTRVRIAKEETYN